TQRIRERVDAVRAVEGQAAGIVNVAETNQAVLDLIEKQFEGPLAEDVIRSLPALIAEIVSEAERLAYEAKDLALANGQVQQAQDVKRRLSLIVEETRRKADRLQDIVNQALARTDKGETLLTNIQESEKAAGFLVAQAALITSLTNARAFVNRAYQEALGRGPTGTEMKAALEGLFVQGLTDRQWAGTVLETPEFAAENLSNMDFVQKAVQVILGRAATAEEISVHGKALDDNEITRTDLIHTLAASSEVYVSAKGSFDEHLGRFVQAGIEPASMVNTWIEEIPSKDFYAGVLSKLFDDLKRRSAADTALLDKLSKLDLSDRVLADRLAAASAISARTAALESEIKSLAAGLKSVVVDTAAESKPVEVVSAYGELVGKVKQWIESEKQSAESMNLTVSADLTKLAAYISKEALRSSRNFVKPEGADLTWPLMFQLQDLEQTIRSIDQGAAILSSGGESAVASVQRSDQLIRQLISELPSMTQSGEGAVYQALAKRASDQAVTTRDALTAIQTEYGQIVVLGSNLTVLNRVLGTIFSDQIELKGTCDNIAADEQAARTLADSSARNLSFVQRSFNFLQKTEKEDELATLAYGMEVMAQKVKDQLTQAYLLLSRQPNNQFVKDLYRKVEQVNGAIGTIQDQAKTRLDFAVAVNTDGQSLKEKVVAKTDQIAVLRDSVILSGMNDISQIKAFRTAASGILDEANKAKAVLQSVIQTHPQRQALRDSFAAVEASITTAQNSVDQIEIQLQKTAAIQTGGRSLLDWMNEKVNASQLIANQVTLQKDPKVAGLLAGTGTKIGQEAQRILEIAADPSLGVSSDIYSKLNEMNALVNQTIDTAQDKEAVDRVTALSAVSRQCRELAQVLELNSTAATASQIDQIADTARQMLDKTDRMLLSAQEAMKGREQNSAITAAVTLLSNDRKTISDVTRAIGDRQLKVRALETNGSSLTGYAQANKEAALFALAKAQEAYGQEDLTKLIAASRVAGGALERSSKAYQTISVLVSENPENTGFADQKTEVDNLKKDIQNTLMPGIQTLVNNLAETMAYARNQTSGGNWTKEKIVQEYSAQAAAIKEDYMEMLAVKEAEIKNETAQAAAAGQKYTVEILNGAIERLAQSQRTDDFEYGVDGWSAVGTSMVEGNTVLGGRGQFGAGSTAEKVFQPGEGDQTVISFDFYYLDSWYGESAYIEVNGQRQWTQSYHYAQGGMDGPAGQGMADSKQHIEIRIPNTGAPVTVHFGTTLNPMWSAASWAVDNVSVTGSQPAVPLLTQTDRAALSQSLQSTEGSFDLLEAKNTEGASLAEKAAAASYTMNLLTAQIEGLSDKTMGMDLLRMSDQLNSKIGHYASILGEVAGQGASEALSQNIQTISVLSQQAGLDLRKSFSQVDSIKAFTGYDGTVIDQAFAAKGVFDSGLIALSSVQDPDKLEALRRTVGESMGILSVNVSQMARELPASLSLFDQYQAAAVLSLQRSAAEESEKFTNAVYQVMSVKNPETVMNEVNAIRAAVAELKNRIQEDPAAPEAKAYLAAIETLSQKAESLGLAMRMSFKEHPEQPGLMESDRTVREALSAVLQDGTEAKREMGVSSEDAERRLIEMIDAKTLPIPEKIAQAVVNFYQDVLDVYQNQATSAQAASYQTLINTLTTNNPLMLTSGGIAQVGVWLGEQAANIINCAAHVVTSYFAQKGVPVFEERIAAAVLIEDILNGTIVPSAEMGEKVTTSLYAISKLSESKGISAVAVQLDGSKLDGLTMPVMALVDKDGSNHLVLITAVSDQSVTYESNGALRTDPRADFAAVYKGIVMADEADLKAQIDAQDAVLLSETQMKQTRAGATPDVLTYVELNDFGLAERVWNICREISLGDPQGLFEQIAQIQTQTADSNVVSAFAARVWLNDAKAKLSVAKDYAESLRHILSQVNLTDLSVDQSDLVDQIYTALDQVTAMEGMVRNIESRKNKVEEEEKWAIDYLSRAEEAALRVEQAYKDAQLNSQDIFKLKAMATDAYNSTFTADALTLTDLMSLCPSDQVITNLVSKINATDHRAASDLAKLDQIYNDYMSKTLTKPQLQIIAASDVNKDGTVDFKDVEALTKAMALVGKAESWSVVSAVTTSSYTQSAELDALITTVKAAPVVMNLRDVAEWKQLLDIFEYTSSFKTWTDTTGATINSLDFANFNGDSQTVGGVTIPIIDRKDYEQLSNVIKYHVDIAGPMTAAGTYGPRDGVVDANDYNAILAFMSGTTLLYDKEYSVTEYAYSAENANELVKQYAEAAKEAKDSALQTTNYDSAAKFAMIAKTLADNILNENFDGQIDQRMLSIQWQKALGYAGEASRHAEALKGENPGSYAASIIEQNTANRSLEQSKDLFDFILDHDINLYSEIMSADEIGHFSELKDGLVDLLNSDYVARLREPYESGSIQKILANAEVIKNTIQLLNKNTSASVANAVYDEARTMLTNVKLLMTQATDPALYQKKALLLRSAENDYTKAYEVTVGFFERIIALWEEGDEPTAGQIDWIMDLTGIDLGVGPFAAGSVEEAEAKKTLRSIRDDYLNRLQALKENPTGNLFRQLDQSFSNLAASYTDSHNKARAAYAGLVSDVELLATTVSDLAAIEQTAQTARKSIDSNLQLFKAAFWSKAELVSTWNEDNEQLRKIGSAADPASPKGLYQVMKLNWINNQLSLGSLPSALPSPPAPPESASIIAMRERDQEMRNNLAAIGNFPEWIESWQRTGIKPSPAAVPVEPSGYSELQRAVTVNDLIAVRDQINQKVVEDALALIDTWIAALEADPAFSVLPANAMTVNIYPPSGSDTSITALKKVKANILTSDRLKTEASARLMKDITRLESELRWIGMPAPATGILGFSIQPPAFADASTVWDSGVLKIRQASGTDTLLGIFEDPDMAEDWVREVNQRAEEIQALYADLKASAYSYPQDQVIQEAVSALNVEVADIQNIADFLTQVTGALTRTKSAAGLQQRIDAAESLKKKAVDMIYDAASGPADRQAWFEMWTKAYEQQLEEQKVASIDATNAAKLIQNAAAIKERIQSYAVGAAYMPTVSFDQIQTIFDTVSTRVELAQEQTGIQIEEGAFYDQTLEESIAKTDSSRDAYFDLVWYREPSGVEQPLEDMSVKRLRELALAADYNSQRYAYEQAQLLADLYRNLVTYHPLDPALQVRKAQAQDELTFYTLQLSSAEAALSTAKAELLAASSDLDDYRKAADEIFEAELTARKSYFEESASTKSGENSYKAYSQAALEA
ncbi:MAG: hypothetical protein COT00_01775, partial [Candidatus Omnitrophica bacterium CG07_land_8_20_14_0_80_50_8]